MILMRTRARDEGALTRLHLQTEFLGQKTGVFRSQQAAPWRSLGLQVLYCTPWPPRRSRFSSFTTVCSVVDFCRACLSQLCILKVARASLPPIKHLSAASQTRRRVQRRCASWLSVVC